MPLVLDPYRLTRPLLEDLVNSLRNDLDETAELVAHPRGKVLEPASLRTAQELLDAARAVLGRSGPRSPAELAAEANLAYATMLSVTDLVKSHTDVPKVPRRR